jgi:hypothetical protein
MKGRPHGNCYWVRPGLLLAGEYPSAPDQRPARQRLGRLLDHGIASFVDLTEPDELPAYQPWLQAEAELRGLSPRYRRLAIRDRDIPASPLHMVAMLDHLDAELVARRPVYLHCWGGVGRTGTVVGCWLVRHGASGEQALQTLAGWWRAVDKSWRHPRSPETDAQQGYVLDWSEPQRRPGTASADRR